MPFLFAVVKKSPLQINLGNKDR